MRDSRQWLFSRSLQSAPPDGSNLGYYLKSWRVDRGFTQVQAADVLSTNQSRLSKIESGAHRVRDVEELRWFANKLEISEERLGILSNNADDNVPEDVSSGISREIERSHDIWRATRRTLNENRPALSRYASSLYPDAIKVRGTTAITRDSWLAPTPLGLSDVELRWLPEAPTPSINGRSQPSEATLPYRRSGDRYTTYSRVLRDLARPRLLDNRWSYRAVDLDLSPSRERFDFHYTTYFEAIDVCEALAHELAHVWIDSDASVSLEQLPLRRAIPDPFELSVRPALPSVNTFTIRLGARGDHRMYLHKRDPAAVAIATSMYHVSPAGVFQPATLAPESQSQDFSLWRNTQREFSEEFLGNPEHDGNSFELVDYVASEPFVSMDAALQSGAMRVSMLGVVLEPLSLWAEILTVAVIEDRAFDSLFADMVEVNDEGAAVSTESNNPTVGIPFTAEALKRVWNEPLSSVARANMVLAWDARDHIM